MTAEYPHGDEPLIPMPALSLPALRQAVATVAPSRLPALAAVRQVAGELTARESVIFLDGREFAGEPPGLRTVQRGPLMLVY
jgi:hypothetical protein